MSLPCAPDRTAALLQDMQRRLRYLEKNLAGFQEITGICTTAGQSVVSIIASEYDPDTGIFTLTISSLGGDRFQVQTSSDNVTWTIAENVVTAAASPAVMTTWESDAYELEDFPVYFRVRKYPAMLVPCNPSTLACPDIITSSGETE